MLSHPNAERLLSFVQMDPNGGCWLWEGALSHNGYGVLFDGQTRRAHRYSFEAFKGEIGQRHVLHKCDIRQCVNPEHLFLGTQKENMADMVRKGRGRGGSHPGEAHALARLTDDQVREIRSSTESSRQIAKRLPVGDCMVRRIRRGLAWSHIQ